MKNMKKKACEPEFVPAWNCEAPPPDSFRSLLKWGDPKVFKHPNRKLYKLMKSAFGMTDEDFKAPKNAGLEKVPQKIGRAHV